VRAAVRVHDALAALVTAGTPLATNDKSLDSGHSCCGVRAGGHMASGVQVGLWSSRQEAAAEDTERASTGAWGGSELDGEEF
jgi:hypothetical protein